MQNRILKTLSKSIPGGITLSREDFSSIENLFTYRTLNKNEVFFRPGHTTKEIALILSGVIRHYFIDGQGREKTTDFCRAGEFSGSLDAIGEEGNIWLAAACRTEIAVAPQGDFMAVIYEHPELQKFFSNTLIHYLQLKTKRETELLGLLPDERYTAFIRNFPELTELVPQYLIASYLGMTAETLSRVRNRRE